MYSNGDGVQKDNQKALKYYRRAAELGNRAAKCDLGVMLLSGEGGEQAEEEAVLLIADAAMEGHVVSQFNLGVLYYYGEDIVAQDSKTAEYWLRLAAENGDTDAQQYICECFD